MDDIFISILKQLATSMSPTQFLTVLCAIAIAAVMLVRIFIKSSKRKHGILGFLSSDDSSDEVIDAITKLSANNVSENTKVIEMLNVMRAESKEQHEDFLKQMTEFMLLRQEIRASGVEVTKILENIQHQQNMNDVHLQQSYENLKDIIQRNQELMNRASSQLEKIDEFTRAVVPEFRSYHKELSKEIGEVSRDIALVERSIQTQINTQHAVKLR